MAHTIRWNDKVYSYARKDRGLQPNGRIEKVFWEDREPIEILVEWLSSPASYETISYDAFDGCYSLDFGGTWYIEA